MKEELTLLIAEDEEIMRKELEMAINWNELGIKIIANAEDGIEGEKLIKELDPDIVLTDIKLPKQSGLDMIAACPMLYQNVIVLSGYTDFAYTRKAIQLGVYDYLEKPVDDEELENIISSLAERIREDHLKEGDMKKENNFIPLPEKVNNHQINCTLEFIREHFAEPISLSEAAAYVKHSEKHLSTLFKEVVGINYLQYLNAYRINHAIELMKKEDLNITEISSLSGFPTPGYFSKLFRRFTGKTPREYRDNLS